jgi:hypothetical protein
VASFDELCREHIEVGPGVCHSSGHCFHAICAIIITSACHRATKTLPCSLSHSMPTRARAVSSCLDRCCRVVVIGSGPPGPSLGPNGGPCVPPEPCHTNRSYFGQADLSRKLKVNDSPLHHRCSLCCFWWVGEWTCMWVVHASQWIFTHSSLCTCNHGCANKVLVKWRMVWCEREHLCSIHNYNS